MGLGVHNPLDPQCYLYLGDDWEAVREPGEVLQGSEPPRGVVDARYRQVEEPVAKTAWEIIDGVATSAVHAHADEAGMAPGLVVTDWVFMAVARGFSGDKEINQDVFLRSGSPMTLLGMLDVARSSHKKETLRGRSGE